VTEIGSQLAVGSSGTHHHADDTSTQEAARFQGGRDASDSAENLRAPSLNTAKIKTADEKMFVVHSDSGAGRVRTVVYMEEAAKNANKHQCS